MGGNKPIVLIVDDIGANLKVLGELVQNCGYEAAFAMDGKQVFEYLEVEKPDMILLDIMMPGMDGYDVCRAIKGDSRTSDIPVLFITARTDPEDLAKGFAVGGVDYITKPFHPTEVAARVETHLQLSATTKHLEQVICEKDQLLTIIGHDLKNPFASILGISALILGRKNSLSMEQVVGYVEKIHHSGKMLHDLLENLLDWTGINAGTVKLEVREIELGGFVEETLSLYQTIAHNKKIQLVNQTGQQEKVAFDGRIIATILRNLINNAIKFTPEDGRIEVKAELTGDMLKITVSDSGIGMGSEQVEEILRFNSIRSTKGTAGENGSGLGLSIVKGLVAQNGGRINIESTPGQGTSFGVSLKI